MKRKPLADTALLRPSATLGLPYLRLSGADDEELSPDIQLKFCLRALKELGLDCDPKPYQEGGDLYSDAEKGRHSAFKRNNMKAWQALLRRAEQDERVGAVVAYDLSRMFRNVEAMLREAELLNSFGVILYPAKGETLDLKSARGRKRAIDDANDAEYESRVTSERLRDHYAELRSLGLYVPHLAPCGLKRVGSSTARNAQFVPSDETYTVAGVTRTYLETIIAFLRLYTEERLGVMRAARVLDERGYRWRGKTGPSHIQETYLARTLLKLEFYRDSLDSVLYRRVQQERARKSERRNGNRQVLPPNLLAGVARCARCRLQLYVNHSSYIPKGVRATERLALYRHPLGGCRPMTHITAHVLDAQVWDWLRRLNTQSPQEKERRALALSQPPAPDPDVLDRQLQREKLETRLKNLIEMLADGDISKEQYRERKAQYEHDLAALPEAAGPALLPAYSYAEALELQENLAAVIEQGARSDPQTANRLMRELFSAVWVDFDTRTVTPELAAELSGWL